MKEKHLLENDYLQYGARLYDSETGRFLSVDPMFEDFRNQTPYHYAFNSPVQWKDPSGLFAVDEKGEKVQWSEIEVSEEDLMAMEELCRMAFEEAAEYTMWLAGKSEESEWYGFMNFMNSDNSDDRLGDEGTDTHPFTYYGGFYYDFETMSIKAAICIDVEVKYDKSMDLSEEEIEAELTRNLNKISSNIVGVLVLSTLPSLKFDITYSGYELKAMWCREIDCEWLGGISSNKW